ncbi:ATP-binding protein [Rhodococcus qingshengii]|uniref:ATP-binding protein n=1 Tax=Rhodococcus qingshengii TaxID=334542 RepID=A0AAW6LX60_RHOSG|nr:ATP-binding protein [Rhodococcus qingshengii]MDE8649702.1 ATP-binding protein [Rhodococcus qingshengii]
MTSPTQAPHIAVAATPSLSVPASVDQLALLRAIVRTAADHHGLPMDAVADLVLAVDEAATTLISHARRSSILMCAFDTVTDPNTLRVVLTATTSSPVDASTSSFGWLVLQTLVDHVALEQTPATTGDDRSATITLEKALPARS